MQAAEKALEFLVQHPEYIQKAVPASDAEKASKKMQNEEAHEFEDDTDNTSEANLDGDSGECLDDEQSSAKRLKKTDGEDGNDRSLLENLNSNEGSEGLADDEEHKEAAFEHEDNTDKA